MDVRCRDDRSVPWRGGASAPPRLYNPRLCGYTALIFTWCPRGMRLPSTDTRRPDKTWEVLPRARAVHAALAAACGLLLLHRPASCAWRVASSPHRPSLGHT